MKAVACCSTTADIKYLIKTSRSKLNLILEDF